MPELEDIEAQRELLRVYRRNLALYLQQQAEQGGSAYVTPAVANGIRDARDQIAQIKAVLRGWGQAVDDHPNDAPALTVSSMPGTPDPARAVDQLAPTVATPVATAAPATIDPDGLEAYFTDVEHLREAFRQLVSAPTLPKRLFVIHGVGGAGKSSLLRMFRIYARRAGIPIALASGDEVKSAVDILANWSDDLQAAGVPLPITAKTLARYRGVQTAVERQSQKASAVAGKLAVKTAEGVAGSVAGAAIGSVFPVIGTVAGAAVGALVGTGGEALSDWLSTFLKRPDIDLLLDPTRQLTDAFLADLDKAAARQRIVLLLDTFEQLSALEDWARDLAQRRHRNVLLVIGGRAVPAWGRAWSGWLAQARVEELKPMTREIMRELIRRYYATMHGGEPDSVQVEAIIGFARGLPVVVTSAVQLWVAYGVEDFQSVKPQVVADMVDRLVEGVPRELVPMLEAAAALRWFNKDLLRAVTQQDNVDAAYDELRRFPFIRPRPEGLTLHDAVREIIDDNLQLSTPDRHRMLHTHAALYFSAQRENVSGVQSIVFGLEQLYHELRANEEIGIRLFRQMAEELVRFRFISRLRTLLKDVEPNRLQLENSRLWWQYYNACLMEQERHLKQAELIYQAISEDQRAERSLRAYALCDLGGLLTRGPLLSTEGGIQRATKVLEQAQQFIDPKDPQSITILAHLQDVSRYVGDWEKVDYYLSERVRVCTEIGYTYKLVVALYSQARNYGFRGQWRAAFDTELKAIEASQAIEAAQDLRRSILGDWYWIHAGRYSAAEHREVESLHLARQLDTRNNEAASLLRLGYVCGRQRKIAEAERYFTESQAIIAELETTLTFYLLLVRGAIALLQGNVNQATEWLQQSLEGKRRVDPNGVPEVLVWQGAACEIYQSWFDAEQVYRQVALEPRWRVRHYFRCEALTGLVRVKHALGDYDDAIPALLGEAEALAQQYEYNDHLASLRLTQAQLAWDGALPALGRGFDSALGYYKQALIYALRYNRFLLDEALWGGGVCTPLKPIIPHSLERTFEGQRMLAALRDWWQSGTNDLGIARPDTISPIPEGIPLLEAERIAREREPGDGTPQRRLVDAIDEMLG